MLSNVTSVEDLEQALAREESIIARARARQIELIRRADADQLPAALGCRTITEWVSGRADVSPDTAASLVHAASLLRDKPLLGAALADGDVTFDRTVALARLARPGEDADALLEFADRDIDGLRRLSARRRRLTRNQERQAFVDRYLVMQPNLDESSWRLAGQLPGYWGRVVDEAISQVADTLPEIPGQVPPTLRQRHADALVKMAQDALDPVSETGVKDGGRQPLATVFVDAGEAAATGGETGAAVEAGPQVGPQTLEMILCAGAVEVTATTDDGRPLALGPTSRTIPPRLRRWILHRDGGCTADGCASRYRLQPHHILPRSQGGTNDPDNLTTLCWYHHHVVIHGLGYRINPHTPRTRIRFLAPARPRDPP